MNAILYWSKDVIRDPADIKKRANQVTVRPLQLRTVPDDFMLIHKQSNGRTISNNVGWREKISMTISDDQLSLLVDVKGKPIPMREVIHAWERASYQWIQAPSIHSGQVVLVSFLEKPSRSHPGEYDFLHEYSYLLQAQVFHINV